MAFDEKFVDHVIESYPIDPKLVALDIGANVGKYSTKMAKKFGKVYAIEASPLTCQTLKENLKKEKVRNVEVCNIGICDIDDDEVKLYTQGDGKNKGGNTLSFFVAKTHRWGHNENKFQVIRGVTLDTFVKEKKIENLRFIKMDIEGGENFAWRGAEETLKNNYLDIMLEVHQCVHYQELYKFFDSRGYKAYVGGGKRVEGFTADTHYLITNRA